MIFWNVLFHLIVAQMAENQYLMPSLERLLIDQARIGQTFWRARTAEMRKWIDTADQHNQMIEMIRAGDEEATVALTLEHRDLSSDLKDVRTSQPHVGWCNLLTSMGRGVCDLDVAAIEKALD